MAQETWDQRENTTPIQKGPRPSLTNPERSPHTQQRETTMTQDQTDDRMHLEINEENPNMITTRFINPEKIPAFEHQILTQEPGFGLRKFFLRGPAQPHLHQEPKIRLNNGWLYITDIGNTGGQHTDDGVFYVPDSQQTRAIPVTSSQLKFTCKTSPA